jgi:hypothetical protein
MTGREGLPPCAERCSQISVPGSLIEICGQGYQWIAHKSEKETPVQVIEIEINWGEHLHRWMQPG